MKSSKLLIALVIFAAISIAGYLTLSGNLTQSPSKQAQQGPTPPPLLANAPPYQCPKWMDADTCALLKTTCGNGVCEPHERCNTCTFDCGCGGGLICSPDFGRCYAPPVEDPDVIRLCIPVQG